jgi:hypothetical protein
MSMAIVMPLLLKLRCHMLGHKMTVFFGAWGVNRILPMPV